MKVLVRYKKVHVISLYHWFDFSELDFTLRFMTKCCIYPFHRYCIAAGSAVIAGLATNQDIELYLFGGTLGCSLHDKIYEMVGSID